MPWFVMTRASSLFLAALLVTVAASAEARPAKCLFEIGDTHHIGAVCEFTRTDDKGSFRIADTGHSGISAEVKVTGAGQGVASWTNPRARKRDQAIGEVKQTGACWSDGEARICAWTSSQDVYLGPTQGRKMFVAYGQRPGMDDEVENATGLDTARAVIRSKASRRAAADYCLSQSGNAQTCIEDTYRSRAKAKDRTITADCPSKEWVGRDGSRYRFLGPFDRIDRSRFADGGKAKWAILDVKNNTLIGNCGACGYDMIHDWYEKLCPATAPSEW